MYFDTHCTYRETVEPHTYIFTGPCSVTGKPVSVAVKSEELFAYRQGALAQDAFISNSDDEREFLITGTSAEGWNMLFSDDEEGE